MFFSYFSFNICKLNVQPGGGETACQRISQVSEYSIEKDRIIDTKSGRQGGKEQQTYYVLLPLGGRGAILYPLP